MANGIHSASSRPTVRLPARLGVASLAFYRVIGDSLINYGLNHNDCIAVELTQNLEEDDIAVFHEEGEFSIKCIVCHKSWRLNPNA